eukprot:3640478-Alexandrium_andersonii.AAC.1
MMGEAGLEQPAASVAGENCEATQLIDSAPAEVMAAPAEVIAAPAEVAPRVAASGEDFQQKL